MPEAPDPVARLLARLRATAKYQGLCDEVLVRVASDAWSHHGSEKAALKAAKRKLHQAFGAFLHAAQRKAVLKVLTSISPDADPATRRARLVDAALLHASTAERIAHHEALWGYVLAHTPPPDSVLDLGCGMAPALLPWTGLHPHASYRGLDLDGPLCAALEAAVQPLFPHATVATADLQEGPLPAADLTLLWKLLPTLERQRGGAAHDLMARLGPTTVVATFPTKTLTGRDRGMAATYVALADRVLGPGLDAQIGDELVRIVRWGGGGDAR